jgi:hypothetical protein
MELVPPAFQLTNTISEMSNPYFFNPMRKSVGLYLLGPSRVVIIFWENVFSENSNTKNQEEQRQ